MFTGLDSLKYTFTLIDSSVRGWMTLAVLGSVGIAALDTLGVAAMIPLMQVITGDMSSGAAAFGVLPPGPLPGPPPGASAPQPGRQHEPGDGRTRGAHPRRHG